MYFSWYFHFCQLTDSEYIDENVLICSTCASHLICKQRFPARDSYLHFYYLFWGTSLFVGFGEPVSSFPFSRSDSVLAPAGVVATSAVVPGSTVVLGSTAVVVIVFVFVDVSAVVFRHALALTGSEAKREFLMNCLSCLFPYAFVNKTGKAKKRARTRERDSTRENKRERRFGDLINDDWNSLRQEGPSKWRSGEKGKECNKNDDNPWLTSAPVSCRSYPYGFTDNRVRMKAN